MVSDPQVRSIVTTRTRLLAAAGTIVEDGGSRALTTQGAAHAAGVAVGSVYRYFGDRYALLAATTALQRRDMQRLLATAVAGADPADVSTIVVDHLMRCYGRSPRLARAGLDDPSAGANEPAVLIAAAIASALHPDAEETAMQHAVCALLPACRIVEASVAFASPIAPDSHEWRVLHVAAAAAFAACLRIDAQP